MILGMILVRKVNKVFMIGVVLILISIVVKNVRKINDIIVVIFKNIMYIFFLIGINFLYVIWKSCLGIFMELFLYLVLMFFCI